MVKFHSILGGQLFEKIAKNEVKLAKIRKKSLYLTEPGVKTAICRKNLFGYSETSNNSLSDSFSQIFANSTPSTCKLDPKLGTFTKKSIFTKMCEKCPGDERSEDDDGRSPECVSVWKYIRVKNLVICCNL